MAGAATGPTLPPEDLRRSLDESVHTGVTRRIEQIPAEDRADPSRSCILYALVGERILRRYVDPAYSAQARDWSSCFLCCERSMKGS